MRLCEICGQEVRSGMTVDGESFYVHEGKCFKKYMNQTYGKHKWMQLGGETEDGCGGYYIVTDDTSVTGYSGTGIYWTEWE